jgi:ribonuclease HI
MTEKEILDAPSVTIYTDGACSGNPGPGGWAAALLAGSKRDTVSGGEKTTTNNRMELTAAIEGLRKLKRPCRVTLYTDSTYLKNGIQSWIHNWKKNGWKTAAKKPVLNEELWRELDKIAATHQITWQWVKAHAGNEMNELVDTLAVAELERYK